jgi:DNA-directed RNA polymerase specialized sigma24 family protein
MGQERTSGERTGDEGRRTTGAGQHRATVGGLPAAGGLRADGPLGPGEERRGLVDTRAAPARGRDRSACERDVRGPEARDREAQDRDARDRVRRYLDGPHAADALDRARVGDPAAVDAVLDAVRPLLVAAAARGLAAGDVPARDAAEDVAQVALVRVAAHLGTCRATSPVQFAAWALAIGRRAVWDARAQAFGERSRRRTPLDHLLAGGDEWLLAVDPHEPGEGLRGSPAMVALLRAALDAHDAYAAASARSAELIWMRVVGAATWEDIATVVGASPSAVKRRFQRAQRRLRREAVRRVHALPADERARALALLREWAA